MLLQVFIYICLCLRFVKINNTVILMQKISISRATTIQYQYELTLSSQSGLEIQSFGINLISKINTTAYLQPLKFQLKTIEPQMKANTSFTPNKKLILHFDIENVLTLASKDKDLYVYELCADWVWGKLEKTSKEDPDKVTGWKIAVNTLSVQCPEADLITYGAYLRDYLRPNQDEYQRLILNLSKGAASKAKSQIEKCIKNITLPKTLAEAIKQTANPNDKLMNYFATTGKYQILPAFFKLLMNLKKTKRQFAIIIKGNLKENHNDVISQLNRLFGGEHPLFNGQNGTPAIKWDGSKGTHNFIIQDSHQAVFYEFGEDLFATYGTLMQAEEKDPQMFKQKFKSLKQIRLCQSPEEIYAVGHAFLSQSACIYEINPFKTCVIDPSDYLTHQIYFTSSQKPKIYSCLGPQIDDTKSFINRVHLFDYLRDVDYLIKSVQQMQGARGAEITKIQKGQPKAQDNVQQSAKEEQKLTNYQYLKKHLLPVLEGALRQVDLHRPEDPLAFIALYCLKNRQRLE